MAGGVRRPRRRLPPLADLRGGVLPRRRAGPGEPERHLPPRSHDHGGRHRRAEGAVPADDGVERDRVGAGVERAQRRAPTSPAIRSTGVLSDDGTEWVLNGQKIWASRAVWADWCFGIFRTDPEAERHRGLTFVLVPLDSPGVTVRPIAQLDGDTGFAEIFFDDVRVPVENTLGEVNQGWRVGDGDGRLRARREPAQPGALQRRRRPPGRALARARRPVRHRAARRGRRRVDAGRGLQAAHLHDGHADDRGRHHRRRGEPQQDLLERDGRPHPRARARHRRPRSRADGRAVRALGRRLPVLAVGPDLRRAPTRSSATSSPTASSSSRGVPDAVRVHRRPEAVRRGAARPARQGVHAARTCAPRGTTAPATTSRCGTTSPRWACSAMLVPEARRRPRRRPRSTSCCCSRSSGGPRCRGRCSRPRPCVAPALGDGADRAAPPRSTARRTCRTRTSRPWCSCPAASSGPRARRSPRSTASTAAAGCFTVDGGAVEPFDYDEALAFDRGALAAAAYLVGLSERMIDVAGRVRARSASSTAGRSA